MNSRRFAALVVMVMSTGITGRSAAQNAINFNGTSDYVTMGPAAGLGSTTFTLEAWIRRDNAAALPGAWGTGTNGSTGTGGLNNVVGLITKGRSEADGTTQDCNYFFGLDPSNGRLVADFEQLTAGPGAWTAGLNHPMCSSATISDQNWHHVAVTYDKAVGKGWRFYLDGVDVTAANGSTATCGAVSTCTDATACVQNPAVDPRSDSIQHFALGVCLNSLGTTTGGYFGGVMDEARVWNLARTQAEIQASMNSTLISGTGLVGRWGLNETTGSLVALDVAGTTGEVGSVVGTPTRDAGAPALAAGPETIVSFQQGTNGYASALDTTLNQAAPATAQNTGTTLTVVGTATTTQVQTLLRFDNIFGALSGQIPSSATVLDAGLSVNASNATAAATNLFRMIQDWSASATWDSFVGGVQANGTEAASTADMALTANSVFVGAGIRTADVRASLQAWQTTANRGWAWLQQSPTSTDDLVMSSSDNATVANRPKLTVAYFLASNLPPNAPTVVTPLNGATGVATSPTLTVNVTDPESSPMTVTFFGREVSAAMEDFTIVVLPDTQFYSQTYPLIYQAQLEWIRDNRVARNIVFVTQLGDCVNNQDDAGQEYQWTNANAAWDIIEDPIGTGLADGIPYGIAVGNHDNGGNARSGTNEGGTTIQYTKYFGLQRICPGVCSNNGSLACEKDADCVSPGICNPGASCKNYYGGRYDFGDPVTYFRNTDNHYELFSAGGMDFIAFHLEWDCADGSMGCVSAGVPHATRAATIAWMDNILTNVYPNRRAMISSHYLISPSGSPPAFSNQGQAVYDAVKDNPNVFMTLCGHLDQANRRTDTFGGGTIHSMITDYQTRPNGGRGWMRTLTFSPSTNNIHVETFSPWVNYPSLPRVVQSINSHGDNTAGTPQQEFDLAYSMAPSFAQIGTPQTGVASGGNASVVWSGLNADAFHEWYVTVSDGTNTITGPTWSFTTSCSSDAACDDGNPCTTDVCSVGTGTCQNTNNTNACDDGNACTSGDACSGGACVGTNNSSPCSDGTLCTTGDVCSGGACVGTPVNCTAPATCNSATGTCDQTLTFQQGVGGYSGAKDTFLHSGLPTADNSAAASLITDLSGGSPAGVNQTLLAFESIIGVGPTLIPTGAVISAATLTFNVTNDSSNGFRLRRMLQAWNATDNWNTWVSGIQDNNVECASTVESPDPTSFALGMQTVDVKQRVQAWVNNPATNFGWVLLQHPTTDDGLAFESSEATTVANRPKLTVTFVSGTPCTTASQCNDGNPCTNDDCVSLLCTYTNNTAACTDGNACTTGDVCAGGTCSGTALTCNDSNPCTSDSCNPASGCVFANNTAPCDDGSLCTGGDTCSGGVCVPGTPIPGCCNLPADCNDAEACTSDVCSPSSAFAVLFNGASAHVSMGAAPGLNAQEFTLECWFKRTAAGTNASTGGGGIAAFIPLFGKGSGEAETPANLNMNYTLGINTAANTLAADFEDSATGLNHPVTSAGPVISATDNTWRHAAATYKLDTAAGIADWKLYLDGVLVGSLDVAGSYLPEPASIQHFGLGTMLNSTGVQAGRFAGLLDEVRVWNYARSASDIASNRFIEIPSAPGLIGRWDLDQGTGTVATDSSGGGQNGTLTAATWSTGAAPLINTCSNPAIPGCCHINADCGDSNPCTDDACVANVCQYPNNTNPCDDNSACTTSDACSGGSCVGGPPPNCDDANACTTDSCVPATGCQHANNTLPCSDGDICTGGDTCSAGACQPGSPVPGCCLTAADCDDSDGCTNDSCPPPSTFSMEFTGPAPTGQVSMGAASNLNAQEFTIECWFRRSGTGVANTTGTGGIASLVPLFGKGGPEADSPINLNMNYVIGINTAANTLAADFEDSATGLNHPVTSAGPAIPADNTWHHAAATYKLDTAASAVDWKLYLDGALVGSADVAGSFLPVGDSIQHFGLGTMLTSTGAALGRFQGMLDEVRVWNYARSQSQIQSARLVEIASETGLIGRWSLNDGTGTTALDTSGGARHGTASGAFAWRSDVLAPVGNQCYYADIVNCCETVADCDDSNVCTADACTANSCAHSPVVGCCIVASQCDDGNVCTIDTCVANACQYSSNAVVCNDGDACTDDECFDGAFSAVRCADGVNDHVNLGNNATITNFGTNSRTIEMWLRMDVAPTVDLTGVFRGGRQGSFSQTAIQLRTSPVGVSVSVEDTALHQFDSSIVPLTVGVWHHVALVIDRGTNEMRLYVNGTLSSTVAAATWGTNTISSTDSVVLGAARNNAGALINYFRGAVDELRIWDHARTATQISQNRERAIDSAPGLLARWSFDEGSGGTVTDSVGTLVGTLQNGADFDSASIPALAECANSPIDVPVVCNDSNPCTTEGCNPATGCTNTNNSLPCDDGDACTSADVCGGGTCNGGSPPVCDDTNPCTDDSCSSAIGCVFTDNSAACSDGDPCTTGDTCSGGVCVGGSPLDCDDDNECTDEVCVTGVGCSVTNNSEPCDDLNACTSGDTCDGGACQGGLPVACDDSNPCTTDSCLPTSGCDFSPNANPCNDNNACTTGDTCSAGVCVGGAPPVCNDGNSCTNDSCHPAIGCVFANNSSPCNDGEVCTVSDVCSGGICVGGGPLPCDDSNECTNDACAPGVGCQFVNNTSPCDDDHTCTENDTCAGGSCAGTPIVGCSECTQASDCNDANLCTTDTCQAGICVFTNNSVSCSDGDACTIGDFCTGGVCVGGPPPTCNDGNPCTDDACQPPTGCQFTNNSVACDDGNACTSGDSCSGGACVGGGAVTCDDFNECTDDSCNPTSGCEFVDNSDPCDDGHSCTANDFCAGGICQGTAIGGCTECTSSSQCNDGNVCTTDTCQANVCVYSPNSASCNDGDPCTTGDTCAGGLCVGGAPPVCSDGNPCTNDSCQSGVGCVFVNNTSACSDGNACTVGDACSGGVCVSGSPANCNDANSCTNDSCNIVTGCVNVNNVNACDDGDACTTNDTCSLGVCVGGTPPNCSDGNVCTDDSCHPLTGCVHVVNSISCNDGNACTVTDVCQSGVCVGSGIPSCDDGNVCTNDSCVPATGCAHANNTAPCNDGNACTTNDSCSGGACIGGAAPDCSDGNVCTTDGCNPGTGCTHSNNSGACNDGNACTTADACSSGACLGGPPLACDDVNACTTDSCVPATGCTFTNNSLPCNDGDACTTLDTCSGGACIGGSPPDCGDGNVCTTDGCNPGSGCTHVNNNVACTDNNACTTNDACSGGACVGGPAPNCNDGNVCTADSCVPATGCAHANLANGTSCDDGLFCNGVNTCQSGSCTVGAPDCVDPCEQCEEAADSCEHCILDLDLNGGMGTGDFSFFAGCFGGCYGPTDPCAVANFDGDPNRCAGTGDFAGFAGCFGLTCDLCANCFAPLSVAAARPLPSSSEAGTFVQLVVVDSPSVDEARDVLPESLASVRVGQSFQIEAWVRTEHNAPLAAVYMDLSYPSDLISAPSLEHGDGFATLVRGATDAAYARVRNLGGCATLGGENGNVDGRWTLVATLDARAFAQGRAEFSLTPAEAPYGVSIMGSFGNISPATLSLEGVQLDIVGRPMELDGKGFSRETRPSGR